MSSNSLAAWIPRSTGCYWMGQNTVQSTWTIHYPRYDHLHRLTVLNNPLSAAVKSSSCAPKQLRPYLNDDAPAARVVVADKMSRLRRHAHSHPLRSTVAHRRIGVHRIAISVCSRVLEFDNSITSDVTPFPRTGVFGVTLAFKRGKRFGHHNWQCARCACAFSGVYYNKLAPGLCCGRGPPLCRLNTNKPTKKNKKQIVCVIPIHVIYTAAPGTDGHGPVYLVGERTNMGARA